MLCTVQLRLTQEQNSQQQTASAEITELEEAYTLEEEDSKKAAIKDEIAKKKAELENMLTEFEVSESFIIIITFLFCSDLSRTV